MKKDNNNTNAEKQKKPKGRIIFFFFNLSFFMIILFMGFYSFIMPDLDFSEKENRVLAKAPQLTAQGVVDGSFMKNFESYLTDQFPLRDGAIYLKSYVDRLLGKKEENGAYIGKDGFLFDSQTAYSKEKMSETAKAVNAFAKENPEINMGFLLSPNSSCIYSQKLPEHLSPVSQEESISDFYGMLDEEIFKVDAVSALKKAKDEAQVFYRTDHHWTTRGAFSVFCQLQEPLGFRVNKEDFEFFNVSNKFRGTLGSKVTSVNYVDRVEICLPKNSEGSYFIDFYGEKEKSATFFYQEKLNNNNKYEVFLGGNYSKLSVNTTLEGDRKLLVIKDSYANCLLPMLTPYYTKILVLDPRYMTESVKTTMQEDRFTDVLFLYNANTLFDDSSLKEVLE